MDATCDPTTCPTLAALQAKVDRLTRERDRAQWQLIPLLARIRAVEAALRES